MNPTEYYRSERPEVVRAIPEDARVVLDIGCAAGRLGAALKHERPGLRVYGIEPVAAAAAEAATVLDGAQMGTAESAPPQDWPQPDCIVFADVLEHLVDPWTTLRRWADRLPPGGSVVISLPNVGHWTVLGGLFGGKWQYAEEGLLDRTHLRFFTRVSALELVAGAGLTVEQLVRLRHPTPGLLRLPEALADWTARPADTTQSGRLSARVLDFYTLQFLIVARRPSVR